MAKLTNVQVRLASRPNGLPTRNDFEIVEIEEASTPVHGLPLKTLWLSIDPYMRVLMSRGPSYTETIRVGDVMPGGTVSQVIASNHDNYREGDIVLGYSGWQTYAHSDGKGLRKLDPALAPVSTALGVLGMPGMTAYTGLLNIGDPKPGETVVVAAAAGAVGSVVGQIAKLKGCRVVGIVGGSAKAEYVKQLLGFDDAIDHRSECIAEDLQRTCPNGIDIYFENVGGAVWRAVSPLLNMFARVPVCGTISNYNQDAGVGGRQSDEALIRHVLFKRLRIQGFIVDDFADQENEFLRNAGEWFAQGKLKYREHVVDGLLNSPEALIELLKGENFGKSLVRVAEPN